jgi:Ca2+-binding EF-hand superfamily protein
MSKLNKTVNELLKDENQFEITVKNAFMSLDNNENKLLDFNEVEGLLISFSKQNNLPKPTKKETQNAFNIIDTNKDGKINFDEFKIFFKKYLLTLK